MTGEELDRAIEFLLQHDARLLEQHARFMEEMQQLKEVQKTQSEEISELRYAQEQQAESIRDLAESNRLITAEMREAFDNLIIANEVTRDLAERIGRLAISTSQRVTNLERPQD